MNLDFEGEVAVLLTCPRFSGVPELEACAVDDSVQVTSESKQRRPRRAGRAVLVRPARTISGVQFSLGDAWGSSELRVTGERP